MATESYQTQLERVQNTIDEVETYGQSVDHSNGITWTQADLQTLYRREDRLRIRVKREKNGGIKVRGITPTN